MTDARDSAPNGGPDSIGLSSILRSDDTVLSPVQPGPAQLPALGLPGYEFIREIHRGGQGVVYLALQRSTHRRVAIKIMKEGPFAGPEDRSRFDREVRILAHLKHPSIVAIHDSGSAAGCDYFVMDFVEGQPLDDYLKSHPLSIPDLVELFRRICEAVQSAHELGVVHRDLKPGNIRIDTSGVPYILDFGLAKMPGSAFEASQMTQTGLFIGSLPWASPEQAEGHVSRIDSRTDVYSLGVIFYTALAGHPPYSVSGSVSDAIHQIVNAAPARPSIFHREIESDLETIVLKCLQKEPHRRYANAGEIAYDLAAYQSGQPISAKRDSTVYVIRKKTRNWVRFNPLPAYGVIVLLAFFTARELVTPFIYGGSRLGQKYWSFVTRWASAPQYPAPLNYVRVISISKKTDFEAITSSESLTGVVLDDPRSLRRVHGRLLERLVAASPRVVVFDVMFRQQSEYDDDFVRGIDSLRAVNVDVCVGAPNWSFDENGLPEVSPTLISKVRWGVLTTELHADAPWVLDLFVAHPGSEPLPSLALAAAAAFRQPGSQASLAPDSSDQTITLNYWEPGDEKSRSRRWKKPFDTFQLTAIQVESRRWPEAGIESGDAIGTYALDLPAQSILDDATVDYGAVFRADVAQLRNWFADRAVVVGFDRPGADRFSSPDARTIAGCYAHAIGIESLLSASAIRIPFKSALTWQILVASLLGAIVGAFLGRARGERWKAVWRLFAASAASACLLLLLSLTVFRYGRYLLDPMTLLVASTVAAVLAATVGRSRRVAELSHSTKRTLR